MADYETSQLIAETGASGKTAALIEAADPYDPRWQEMRERSYEIRGGSDWDGRVANMSSQQKDREVQYADQRAIQEIFGKG